MAPSPSIPPDSFHTATILKARLVSLCLYASSPGETQMVQAITRLIQRRGWAHA
jgi:hypothetical protein